MVCDEREPKEEDEKDDKRSKFAIVLLVKLDEVFKGPHLSAERGGGGVNGADVRPQAMIATVIDNRWRPYELRSTGEKDGFSWSCVVL